MCGDGGVYCFGFGDVKMDYVKFFVVCIIFFLLFWESGADCVKLVCCHVSAAFKSTS